MRTPEGTLCEHRGVGELLSIRVHGHRQLPKLSPPGRLAASSDGNRSGSRFRLFDWGLWALPTPAVAWLLSVNFLTTTAVIVGITRQGSYNTMDFVVFTVLALCATVHIVATRPAEERRRAAHLRGKVEHVDQTSIWLFTAALLLPVALLIALVFAIRIQRYVIARKPPARYLYTTCTHILAALSVGLIGQLTGLHEWLVTGKAAGDPLSTLYTAIALVLCIASYFLAQAVLVGVARGLINDRWSVTELVGSRADNVLIIYTLMLAVFATVIASFAIAAIPAVALVAIYCTRTEQRMSQLRSEREQLEVDALHDALTGLPNRRGFDPQAELALVTSDARHCPSAVLMADLDHFKNWNTTLGHFGADQVLTAVADALRRNMRKSDLLCRWGGEEIAIMLPDTDRAEAARLAERLRAAVEALEIQVSKPAGGAPVTVNSCTISIGVAMAPEAGV
jgi:diguanylate cyclase (GGDEF)-like protein